MRLGVRKHSRIIHIGAQQPCDIGYIAQRNPAVLGCMHAQKAEQIARAERWRLTSRNLNRNRTSSHRACVEPACEWLRSKMPVQVNLHSIGAAEEHRRTRIEYQFFRTKCRL